MTSSLIITIVIVLILLIALLLTIKDSKTISYQDRKDILKQLDDIEYSMTLHNNSSNRDGIIRLDSILSKVLQVKNRNSLNCGENLKISKRLIGKNYYQEIWAMHKLRNQIVHENIEVDSIHAVKSFKIYSLVIKKLLQ